MADPESRVAGWDEFENEAVDESTNEVDDETFVATYCLGARFNATHSEIAEVLASSRTLVHRWARRLREEGVDLPRHQRGRGGKPWVSPPSAEGRLQLHVTSRSRALSALAELIMAPSTVT